MTTTPRTPALSDSEQARAHISAMTEPDQLTEATVLVVGCDHRAEPVAHLRVVGCDPAATPSQCTAALDELLTRVPGDLSIQGLALGLTRPGGEEVQAYDRVWFRALHRVCVQRGLAAYGVYTVTRVGTRALQIDDAA